jgi:hypothetical protein
VVIVVVVVPPGDTESLLSVMKGEAMILLVRGIPNAELLDKDNVQVVVL